MINTAAKSIVVQFCYYMTREISLKFSRINRPTSISTKSASNLLKSRAVKEIVIPPNSNTFCDWRRTRHVPWVNSLTPLNSHVIRLCTLRPPDICVPVGQMLKATEVRTEFLIKDGIHITLFKKRDL